VHEFDTQVIIREKLLLTIFERLEAADISLAFPTQTIVFSPSQLEAVRGGAAANGDAADADQTAKAATPALPALPAPPVVWTDATPPPRT
jgi:small-conductance mechanosensitive channel